MTTIHNRMKSTSITNAMKDLGEELAPVDREALYASFAAFKSADLPTRQRLLDANENDVRELAAYLEEAAKVGDFDPHIPALMQRFATFRARST